MQPDKLSYNLTNLLSTKLQTAKKPVSMKEMSTNRREWTVERKSAKLVSVAVQSDLATIAGKYRVKRRWLKQPVDPLVQPR